MHTIKVEGFKVKHTVVNSNYCVQGETLKICGMHNNMRRCMRTHTLVTVTESAEFGIFRTSQFGLTPTDASSVAAVTRAKRHSDVTDEFRSSEMKDVFKSSLWHDGGNPLLQLWCFILSLRMLTATGFFVYYSSLKIHQNTHMHIHYIVLPVQKWSVTS